MSWTTKTWKEYESIFNRIIAHPFNTELMAGTLDRKKFEFYIMQDVLYLKEYQKALLEIAPRLNKPMHTEIFLRLAYETTGVECELHDKVMPSFQLSLIKEQTPNALLFTNYLHTLAVSHPVHEAVAAILVCVWLYKEVGDYILANSQMEGNPYAEWINTYGGVEYAKGVQDVINMTDELARSCTNEERSAMKQAFFMASRMEWLFWDSAYHMDGWNI